MVDILTLITPRFLSIKNRMFSNSDTGRGGMLVTLALIGIGFWCGIFAVTYRLLDYLQSIEQLGDILAYKLLSMVLLTFFSLLIFSSILTSLSKMYLSRDLYLVNSMPVSSYKIFAARWIESTMDSSWMVIVYAIPVFVAYGVIYNAGPFFYCIIALTILFFSIIASGISSILVVLAVIVIPASRIRSIFIFFGLTLFVVLFLAFRLLKPERMVDPEVFVTTMVYLKAMKTPASPLLPSTWAFDCIKAALSGSFPGSLFHLSLLMTCSGTIIFLCLIIADALYFKGLSKSDTAQMRFIRQDYSDWTFMKKFSGPVRAFTIKEIKTFFRDQAQWTQIFLIGALVIIYIYNFSVLPLEKSPIKTVYLENILAFLNMGLAAFVLTAVTARFAYPAVSTERNAFWLVNASPIHKKKFLWIKFFIYFIPLLVLTEVLIVVTNLLLHVTTFMMVLSSVTILFVVPAVIAMGIGLGAAYPDFKAENPVQTVTSFGGFLFMVLCACYIGAVIALEAGPVYSIFMAGIRNRDLTLYEWLWAGGSFFMVFLLSTAATILPMRYGEKKLTEMLI